MKRFITIIAIMVNTWVAHAQRSEQPLPESLYNQFGHLIEPSSNTEWYYFRQGNALSVQQVFETYPELFGLTPDYHVELWRTNYDKAGNAHHKFNVFYKNVRIEGMEWQLHERNGYLRTAHIMPLRTMQPYKPASITAERAIDLALAAYPAEKYLWENAYAQERFRLKELNNQATLYPTPELLWVKPDEGDAFVLAYRMYVFAEKPNFSLYVYVDAATGNIIKDQNLSISCTEGTANTTFNGTQTIYTEYRTDECASIYDDVTDYFSVHECNDGSEIKSHRENDVFHGDAMICDSDNDWNATSGVYMMTITSLWAVSKSFDYFVEEHGHYSFDGSSGRVDVFSDKIYETDEGVEYCSNANFTNVIDNIYFGSGPDCEPGTTDDYNPLDVAGHEMMHGIIYYAHFDALDYQGQSGALNESFADIFGEMVEYWVEGGTEPSWMVNEDAGAIRSFIDPISFGDPKNYLGDNWFDTDSDMDNGGVHTNSSVQNHMFYLLSEGGSGVNEYGIEYEVDGIGVNKAQNIAWHAQYNYLNSDDGYITARNAWIQSAIDLYGSCSDEVIAVGNAWNAVGVTYFTYYDVTSACGTVSFIGNYDAAYGIENSLLLFSEFTLGCNLTINSGAVSYFESGYYIQFNPGFEAKAGSITSAWIDPCEMSVYDDDDLRVAAAETTTESPESTHSFIQLFPNPADRNLTISIHQSDLTEAVIEVYAAAGNLVYRETKTADVQGADRWFYIDASTLPSGMYVVQVNGNGTRFAETCIIQH